MRERIILGVDPGTNVMGFGILRVIEKQLSLVCLDELILKKIESQDEKLKKIFNRTLSLIDDYKPTEFSIETPFFGKNPQSMLKLGRAQGVSMAAALARNVPIVEYLPRKVKMAITGSGSASKEQVAEMLKRLLNIKEFPTKYLDATDGLALAVCHYLNSGNIETKSATKNYSNWADFIKKNNK